MVSLISRWIFRLMVAIPLAIAIGYVPYHAYGPSGMGKVKKLKNELFRLESNNRKLLEHNSQLRIEIGALKSDRRTIERVARDELGLVRENDIVFLFES